MFYIIYFILLTYLLAYLLTFLVTYVLFIYLLSFYLFECCSKPVCNVQDENYGGESDA